MVLSDRERQVALYAFTTGWMASMELSLEEGQVFIETHGIAAKTPDLREEGELPILCALLWEKLEVDRKVRVP
jgi:hypothetical protein